ncbi:MULTISPECIES: L-threonine 3-dehydrogenase [unclassified Fusibacter]|uniref:L-threonine 3-dehydrogenase n=1 Tax=unclassified Fusibacter TaxID=2624464 RepID=UPI0010107A8A|nr:MULTISPECIES: L-threonine 3-dehydrogenase [unclassified Fusibacter]MCK8060987.1 L-threonine 3-dehydrogenase [Fusibacter sp. A2]NPE20559.1 L-threonine 3-dehydrogenase [Fusibacter sp. A1]RXV63756.1 L-threonine 3-dehydrogenase [Fusibacter sp. A1]
MMKAIIKQTPAEGATLVEIAKPKVGEREVLIKVQATSICGTDFHIYKWDEWSQNRIKTPQVMGHEFAGEVIAIGDKVTKVKLGDIVSAETHIVCEVCELCQTGNAHICKDTLILGVDTQGTFAEYVVIPEQNAWLNDKDVSPEYLCIQEPLGNAVHTVLSGEIIGKTIAVVGCGPIGLMAVDVAKASGAAKVIAIEINDYRANLAGEIGADVVLNPMKDDVIARVLEETGGLGVDVVAEMSGNKIAINQALKYIKLGGRMSMLGIPNGKVELDIATDVVFKGITIHGIVGRRMYDTWYQVKGLIQSGKLHLDKIVTHKMPMDDFQKGMDLMESGNCGKVVLFPTHKED